MILVFKRDPSASGGIVIKRQLILRLLGILIGHDEERSGPIATFIDLRNHVAVRRERAGPESDPGLVNEHMLIGIPIGGGFPHADQI